MFTYHRCATIIILLDTFFNRDVIILPWHNIFTYTLPNLSYSFPASLQAGGSTSILAWSLYHLLKWLLIFSRHLNGVLTRSLEYPNWLSSYARVLPREGGWTILGAARDQVQPIIGLSRNIGHRF